MTVGAGEQQPAWVKTILEARDRTAGGVTSAPDGLYLTSVIYPDEMKIPAVNASLPLFEVK